MDLGEMSLFTLWNPTVLCICTFKDTCIVLEFFAYMFFVFTIVSIEKHEYP